MGINYTWVWAFVYWAFSFGDLPLDTIEDELRCMMMNDCAWSFGNEINSILGILRLIPV